jgi:hypothetical protein
MPRSRENHTPTAVDMARSVSSGNGSGAGSTMSGSGTPMARSLSKGEKHGWLHFKHERKDTHKDKEKDKDKESSFLGTLMARRSSKKAKEAALAGRAE